MICPHCKSNSLVRQLDSTLLECFACSRKFKLVTTRTEKRRMESVNGSRANDAKDNVFSGAILPRGENS